MVNTLPYWNFGSGNVIGIGTESELTILIGIGTIFRLSESVSESVFPVPNPTRLQPYSRGSGLWKIFEGEDPTLTSSPSL